MTRSIEYRHQLEVASCFICYELSVHIQIAEKRKIYLQKIISRKRVTNSENVDTIEKEIISVVSFF